MPRQHDADAILRFCQDYIDGRCSALSGSFPPARGAGLNVFDARPGFFMVFITPERRSRVH